MADGVRRTARDLVRHVRATLLRELLSFEGPVDMALRSDGEPPDRSVFATARIPSCDTVAVVRVYEKDLRDPLFRPQIVFLAPEDADLLQGMLAPRRRKSTSRPS